MPRPSTPLISRSAAVAASIEIIDAEGLEALSLPRLARHLDVKAPSLYHHFEDKSEILSEVARAIVAQTVMPRHRPNEDWAEWITRVTLNFRQAVLRHRRAAPVLLQFMPRDVLTDWYETVLVHLRSREVPAHLHILILDGLEKMAIGATLAEAMRPPTRAKPFADDVHRADNPSLARAVDANELTARGIFEQAIRDFLVGVREVGEQPVG